MEAKFTRVNMIDFLSEEVQNRYAKIREKIYPGIEFTVWVRNGPQSMITLSSYESEEALLATIESHQQLITSTAEFVKDIFFYEGGVSGLVSALVTDGFVTFFNEK